MPSAIASHPYFGAVTSEDWNLFFHPAEARPGLIYKALFGCEPSAQHFQALVPMLTAFETFCRNLDAHDATVRRHFETWPASAGTFELVGAIMSGEGNLPWSVTPDFREAQPFSLQYRALDEAVWDYAGILFFPPVFVALFDADGRFRGIAHEVEKGLGNLPQTIPQQKRGSYRHPYFGRCKLDEMARLATVVSDGRKIPLDLFMATAVLAEFEPRMLDGFVPLTERLQDLDRKVRRDFPQGLRLQWLEERMEHGSPALLRALGRVFPDAARPGDVSAESFAAALVLKRGCFSLPPEMSGGAALTLDYTILPARMDDELFAAKFSFKGDLLDIDIES